MSVRTAICSPKQQAAAMSAVLCKSCPNAQQQETTRSLLQPFDCFVGAHGFRGLAAGPQPLVVGVCRSGCRLSIDEITTRRLLCDQDFENGVFVNLQDWGFFLPTDKQRATKKRKNALNGAAAGDYDVNNAVVGAATDVGTVIMVTPIDGGAVGGLEDEHIGAIRFILYARKATVGFAGMTCSS
jgi:hypothetical protein